MTICRLNVKQDVELEGDSALIRFSASFYGHPWNFSGTFNHSYKRPNSCLDPDGIQCGRPKDE